MRCRYLGLTILLTVAACGSANSSQVSTTHERFELSQTTTAPVITTTTTTPATTAPATPALSWHTAPSLRGFITFTGSTYMDVPADIYKMRADGFGVPVLLGSEEFIGSARWGEIARMSPDGEVVFSKLVDGDSELFVISADGAKTVQITDNEASDSDPHWSPDGNRIVFVSDRDGDSELFVTTSDGSGTLQLTDNESSDFAPDWSPDGKSIAFLGDSPGGYNEIFVVSADGLEIEQITDNGFWNESPRWSPDGLHIAFVSNFAACERQRHRCMQIPEQLFEIFVTKADGSETRVMNVKGLPPLVGYSLLEWSD